MDLKTICCGCLSSDRRLYVIKDLTFLEIELNFVQLNNDLKYVCWECKGMLIKMYTFRKKVARAELILNNYYLIYENKVGGSSSDDLSSSLKTLSSLVKEPCVFDNDKKIIQERNSNEVIESPSVMIKTEIISEESIKTEICDSVPIEYDENVSAGTQDCNKKDIQNKESYSQSEAEDMLNDVDLNKDTIMYNSIPVYFDSDSDAQEDVTDNEDNVEKCAKNKNYYVKTLTFDEVMATRKETNWANVKHKCDKCLIQFKSNVQGLKHEKYHSEENEYSCVSCPMTFSSEVQLSTHTSGNHIQYQCKQCAFVCDNVNSITLHVNCLHSDGDYTVFEDVLRNLSVNKPSPCDACLKVLENEWQLHAHRELTHASTHASVVLDDYCVNCKIKFKSSAGYKTHIKRSKHCGNSVTSSQSDGNVEKNAEFGGSPSAEMNPYYKQKCLEEIYSIKKMSEEELNEHREEMRDASDYVRRKYVCGLCVVGFKTRKLLKEHLMLHNADGQKCSAPCGVCRVYCDVTQMSSHVYDHYKEYSCNLCQFSSKDFPTIQDHYKRKHIYFTDDNVNEYTCKYCPSIPVFRNRNTYKYHMMTRHSQVNSCTICGKSFRAKHSLATHIMTVHRTAEPEPQALSECTVCHKMVTSKYLKIHMRDIHTEADMKPFCIECNKEFKNERCYKKHVSSHSKHVTEPVEKKYECPICLRRFISSRLLKYHHNMAHLREKEMSCHICNKKIVSAYDLKRHIDIVHNKIKKKKSKCTVCGEMVVRIKDHMNTHTGQRPYECGVCQDTFSHKSSLYMHNRLVHLKLKKNGKPKKGFDQNLMEYQQE